MKKLFFFRSSATNSGNKKHPSSPPSNKGVYWEKPLEDSHDSKADDLVGNCVQSPSDLFCKDRKQASENQVITSNSGLRRCRSLSSTTLQSHALCSNDPSRSPSSLNISMQPLCFNQSPHCQTCMPERKSKTKQMEAPGSPDSQTSCNDLSGNSSFSSSNLSSKIVDRYIDGEQQDEINRAVNNSSRRNHTGKGNCAGRRPPRLQHTAPVSPTDTITEKQKCHSFRENKSKHSHFSFKDRMETAFGNESPRRLAKNVIEKLSQFDVLPKTKGFDSDNPITVEDIYGGPLYKCTSVSIDGAFQNNLPVDGPCKMKNGYCNDNFPGFNKEGYFGGEKYGILTSAKPSEEIDVELQRKLKEADERVAYLSQELEQESFLQDCGFDLPALLRIIRNLHEEKVSLALEISGHIQCQFSERASAKEKLRLAKAELEAQTRRLEKEKTELQSSLERELDRRSNDWSLKLQKYKSEELRLRERVRELAEQNVSLQREVSSFGEREADSRSMIAHSEVQLMNLTKETEEVREENHHLLQRIYELKEKNKAAEDDCDCMRKSYEDMEKECKGMHKSIARLLRTCSEQEKTIDGLREGLGREIGKDQSARDYDKILTKLRMEQMRLTGVEQELRREMESYRLEVESLRHENINLLNRLKDNAKDGGFFTVKLDQELQARIFCLQSQGIALLNESTELCSKLLEFMKAKACYIPEAKQSVEDISNCLDGQFLMESEMKTQSFRRGAESLMRSLQTISTLLHEKSNLVAPEHLSTCAEGDGSKQPSLQNLKDAVRSELKAETLLTRLLREKLYSKEIEVAQLQAELATAVRGNDILKCEVQNTMDGLSCSAHKLKDLELQMLKKDENICQLQSDFQESRKELTFMRDILPKVSQERDLMWEEVKQYSEKNMLLNSEVNALKKKMEALDEDVLLKEGQITILKDALGKTPDLFSSPGWNDL